MKEQTLKLTHEMIYKYQPDCFTCFYYDNEGNLLGVVSPTYSYNPETKELKRGKGRTRSKTMPITKTYLPYSQTTGLPNQRFSVSSWEELTRFLSCTANGLKANSSRRVYKRIRINTRDGRGKFTPKYFRQTTDSLGSIGVINY